MVKIGLIPIIQILNDVASRQGGDKCGFSNPYSNLVRKLQMHLCSFWRCAQREIQSKSVALRAIQMIKIMSFWFNCVTAARRSAAFCTLFRHFSSFRTFEQAYFISESIESWACKRLHKVGSEIREGSIYRSGRSRPMLKMSANAFMESTRMSRRGKNTRQCSFSISKERNMKEKHKTSNSTEYGRSKREK